MGDNGYGPSIMQHDLSRCYLCGRSDQKLDRHEIFHADMGGKLREKSKRMGLWVMLCHEICHQYGPNAVHRNKDVDLMLKKTAERKAIDYYGLTEEEFIEMFGRNYL